MPRYYVTEAKLSVCVVDAPSQEAAERYADHGFDASDLPDGAYRVVRDWEADDTGQGALAEPFTGQVWVEDNAESDDTLLLIGD